MRYLGTFGGGQRRSRVRREYPIDKIHCLCVRHFGSTDSHDGSSTGTVCCNNDNLDHYVNPLPVEESRLPLCRLFSSNHIEAFSV